MTQASVDICLCTFRRPEVTATLASIDAQREVDDLALRVLVVDNDIIPSARARVLAAARTARVPITYIHAPAGNISVARNAALDAAGANWVAFLDDDETVAPDWLSRLLDCVRETGADAAFGPSQALYDPEAPAWIRRRDYHSNLPQTRNGEVQTGHTCNALLRWHDTPWQEERFEIARGLSGGEDTEFFFRLRRMGATFALAPRAIAYEAVTPERLTYGWLSRRRFRIGQSYASAAPGLGGRLALLATAGAKAGWCGMMGALTCFDTEKRCFWTLRATMHLGVCAGCLSLPSAQLYGR